MMTDPVPVVLPLVWTLTALSCVAVTTRTVVKSLKLGKPEWDDYLMVIAMVMTVVYAVLATLECSTGLGEAYSEISAHDLRLQSAYDYTSHGLGFMAPTFARVSFCVYMLRALGSASMTRIRTLWTFIVLQILINLAISIIVFTQCGTFENLLRTGSYGSECIGRDAARGLALMASAFNALTDLYLTVLPAVVVWKLQQMNTRTKVGVTCTLAVSIFATVASIAKCYYVYELYSSNFSNLTFPKILIVMAVEINVVIIVTSVPALAPLFIKKRSSTSREPTLKCYNDTSSSSAATRPTVSRLSSWANVKRPSLVGLLPQSKRKSYSTAAPIKHDSAFSYSEKDQAVVDSWELPTSRNNSHHSANSAGIVVPRPLLPSLGSETITVTMSTMTSPAAQNWNRERHHSIDIPPFMTERGEAHE